MGSDNRKFQFNEWVYVQIKYTDADDFTDARGAPLMLPYRYSRRLSHNGRRCKVAGKWGTALVNGRAVNAYAVSDTVYLEDELFSEAEWKENKRFLNSAANVDAEDLI